MKIPLSWLKEFINLNQNPAQIAKMLTLAGLEVDGIEQISPGFSQVVVARVLETSKHPDADKLTIAKVTDGTETWQVVCGAPNCRPGIKTALAKVGASLTDEKGETFKVKKGKLRGVESSGMLCSAQELNIGSDHDGIVELGEDLQEGADIAQMYTDIVFDISLTPNLGHCFCVLGVARELSATTGEPICLPKIEFSQNPSMNLNSLVKVKEKKIKKCPRYACRLIKGVKIGPSPDWLQNRLKLCGIRPINNVVDATNFVLLELGHPLHAFDFDEIENHQIVVRNAREGEKIITLDGKERALLSDDLMICDATKPKAIAGIMGGLNSEVKDTTKDVLIESALFLPTAVRKTSKRLGLQSEGSKRFEKGADPNNVLVALDRVTMLIQKIAGGEIVQGVMDLKAEKKKKKLVQCRLSRINSILGTRLGVTEVETIFKRLEMTPRFDGKDTFTVKVPTYRVDVQEEIDLVEEVARIYGYENIPITMPRYHASTLPHAPIYLFENDARERLVGQGLQEFLTCDLIGPSSLEMIKGVALPEDAIVRVLNPTSIEQSILRTTLLPGLLQVVKFNFDRQNQNIYGFEIGRVHFKEGEKYKEQSVAAIVLSGKRRPSSWDEKPPEADFYDLKGIVENFLRQLGVENYTFKDNDLHFFHTGRQAAIMVGALEVGSMGEVHPSIQRTLDVPQRILFCEINLHDLYPLRKFEQRMKEIPIYPASERDWTITLKEEVEIEQIFNIIKKVPSRLLEEVTLRDIYRSEKLGKGLKNATLHFVYRDRNKTVSQEAVDAEHARIINETMKSIQELKLT